MKKNKPKELRGQSYNELTALLGVERGRLLELRIKKQNSALKNPKEMSEIRKNIARIITILSEQNK